MTRATATQQEKYIAFKRAYATVSQCMDTKNYIGAYVVAFSLIEDRIRAMYVVWHRATKHADPSDKLGFAAQVKALKASADIPAEEAGLLLDEAQLRNKLLHTAMWRLDVFSEDVATHAIALTRTLEKLRRAQRKKYLI